MAISFSCECGQEFKVSDSHAGKRIKCQGCGSAVKIPSLPGKKSASDSGAVAVGKGSKKKSKHVSDEEEDPLVHTTSEYDSAYDFDIGKVPLGKLIEEDDPDSPSQKKKKSAGAKDEKPKKKKKKADDEEATNPVLIGVFLLLGLCSLSALGYFGFQKLGGGGGSSEPIEKKFVTFKHEVANWSLEHPEDWTPQPGGGSGGAAPHVLFEGDGAHAIFRMKGSTGGSMIGTMMQPNAEPPQPGEAEPAIGSPADQSVETAIHQFQQNLFKNDYSEFEEEDMKKFTPPFGEGRLSVFTGKEGLLSGRIKGYRATLSDNNYQYNIRAYVPERDWERYEPIFKRMLMSISR